MADEEVQPGPRIVMKKVSEEADIITFYVKNSARVTDDIYEMRRDRWESISSPEEIEVRLEGL